MARPPVATHRACPTPLPASCARRDYTGPSVPALTSVLTSETDYVFDARPGRYYGHPTALRCEWVLARGDLTAGVDPFELPVYPKGAAPDPAFDLAETYDAGQHASANGVIEYRGGAFGGRLRGRLLIVRHSAGQDIQTFDVSAGGTLSNRRTGIPRIHRVPPTARRHRGHRRRISLHHRTRREPDHSAQTPPVTMSLPRRGTTETGRPGTRTRRPIVAVRDVNILNVTGGGLPAPASNRQARVPGGLPSTEPRPWPVRLCETIGRGPST
ncbi:hypothetical protein JOD64_005266 [Micromonospora luteifusca]|uniref:CUB domain-containing protein n=1 Tax=Micromonospora luteifusca TaxID=709860 RepID=A0ABS2M291_9ACTN|nr:hypothetical protein [Micromonospora luteifusca]